MSWIINDMLLGAIAASTGLWVIGIIVTVSYLVIMAWREEKGRMGEYEVELWWSSGGALVELQVSSGGALVELRQLRGGPPVGPW
jgi:hypothetical protein